MQCEESGFSYSRNGQTAVAAAGTTVPLMGVTYATGTITAVVGGFVFTGSGTTFSAANTSPEYRLLTAGGNTYTIVKHESTTLLVVKEPIVDETNVEIGEAGVTYKVYELPVTNEVFLVNRSTNTGALVWVGIRGSADKTASAFSVAKAALLSLPLDLSTIDLWIDVTTSGDKVAWILLR